MVIQSKINRVDIIKIKKKKLVAEMKNIRRKING
jgi:hypothetical protein